MLDSILLRWKNTPAWCEKEWPKTAAISLLKSNPRSSSSVPFWFDSLFTLVSKVSLKIYKTCPKCDESLSRLASHAVVFRGLESPKNDCVEGFFKTEAAQHHSGTKIDPKSCVLCVNESPIRYDFGSGTTAIRYNVDIASKRRPFYRWSRAL